MLGPHVCGVKKEIGGPDRSHDAHDAGSWGGAGRLKCAIIDPTKCSKYTLWAGLLVENAAISKTQTARLTPP